MRFQAYIRHILVNQPRSWRTMASGIRFGPGHLSLGTSDAGAPKHANLKKEPCSRGDLVGATIG